MAFALVACCFIVTAVLVLGAITSVTPETMPVCVDCFEVTIAGTSLASGSSLTDIQNISIVSYPTSVSYVSSTSIVASVFLDGFQTGPGAVTVRSSSAGTSILSNGFTVTTSALKPLSSISATSGPAAGGRLITIQTSRLGPLETLNSVTFNGVTGTLVSKTSSHGSFSSALIVNSDTVGYDPANPLLMRCDLLFWAVMGANDFRATAINITSMTANTVTVSTTGSYFFGSPDRLMNGRVIATYYDNYAIIGRVYDPLFTLPTAVGPVTLSPSQAPNNWLPWQICASRTRMEFILISGIFVSPLTVTRYDGNTLAAIGSGNTFFTSPNNGEVAGDCVAFLDGSYYCVCRSVSPMMFKGKRVSADGVPFGTETSFPSADSSYHLSLLHDNSILYGIQTSSDGDGLGFSFYRLLRDGTLLVDAQVGTSSIVGDQTGGKACPRRGGGYGFVYLSQEFGGGLWKAVIVIYNSTNHLIKSFSHMGVNPASGMDSPRCLIVGEVLYLLYANPYPTVALVRIDLEAQQDIVVQTPAMTAGTGPVAIGSTMFGQFVFDAVSYTAHALATLILTPNTGPIAGGTVITISSSSLPIGTGSDITSATIGGVGVSMGAQTTSSILVTTAAASAGAVTVSISSTTYGAPTSTFTFNPVGVLSGVSPSNGPAAGANTITILASTSIGSSTDITSVMIAGNSATIASQTTSSVTVTAPAHAAGSVSVTVGSVSFGVTTLASAYTYNVPGVFANTVPAVSSAVAASHAACAITLQASVSFGSGNDITGVSIAGVSAVISAAGQTASQVVVYAPTASVGVNSITIQSTSIGTTVGSVTYAAGGSVTSLYPTSGPLVGGSAVTIRGVSMQDRVFVTSQYGDGVYFGGVVAASTVSQSSTMIVVITPAGASAGASAVLVFSCYGNMSAPSFTFNAVGVISTVTPNNGPHYGGQLVTIAASSAIGNGTDITSVTICGLPCPIQSQTGTSVTVTTAVGSANVGLCAVAVYSVSYGTAVLASAYTFNAAGLWNAISAATGANGVALATSCRPVTITGTGLGNGNDITAVTFGGVAANIVAQSATHILVFTPAAAAGSVTVTVFATFIGQTVSPANAYSFEAATIASLSLTNGPVIGQREITITTVNSAENIAASQVLFGTTPATILSQSLSQISVQLPAHAAGAVTVTVSSCYGSLTTAFTYNAVGTVASVVPNIGQFAGGFTVTITAAGVFGDGSDITQVLLNNVEAQIVSQTASAVTVTASAASSLFAGSNGTVSVSSLHYGTADLLQGFTYRAIPTIDLCEPSLSSTSGNVVITISGSNLGSGSDITEVTLADIAASIGAQTSTSVTVTSIAASIRVGGVNVTSQSFGRAVLPLSFSYAQFGAITAVLPDNGPAVGGNRVTILGGLGTGNDIFSVTFDGVACTILSRSAGSVVVIAAGHSANVQVDVIVTSNSAGQSIRSLGYKYNANGVITDVQPRVGPASGYRVTVTGTNLGNSDITSVSSGVLVSQSPTQVVFHVTTAGSFVLSSVSYGAIVPDSTMTLVLNPAGLVITLLPTTAHVQGGAYLTIVGLNMGSGTDVYNVTVAGVSATVLSQSSAIIMVQLPSVSTARSGQVIVSSTLFGTTASSTNFRFIPQLLLNTSSSVVYERGSPVSVQCVLDCEPSAAVTVIFSASTKVEALPASLIFTRFNWNIVQSVSMSPVTDTKVTGNIPTGALFITTSSDANFNSLNAQPALTFIDTDVATIQVSRGTFSATAALRLGGYFLSEGDVQSLDVRLSSIPSAAVNVSFTVSAPSRVSMTAFLVFTPANWNVTQQAQVIGIVDPLPVAEPLSWIQVAVTVSTTDVQYSAAATSLQLLLLDTDLSATLRVISSSAFTNVTESGGECAFFVLLCRSIVGTAVVQASVSQTLEATVSPSNMTLSNADLMIPQPMVLRGLDDDVQDGDAVVDLTLSLVVNGVTSSSSLRVFNVDNDVAGVSVSPASLRVNETGSMAQLVLTAHSQPTAAVTVWCLSNNTAEAQVVPSVSTQQWLPSTWRSTLSFQVVGVRDNVHDNSSCTVYCYTASSDANYANRVVNVTVSNADISWPVITMVQPTVFALVGTEATITGIDFLAGIAADVQGFTVQNVTQPVSGVLLRFRTPVISSGATGYLNMTLRNPDGGYLVHSRMFFTEDCPVEGLFGRGLNCSECPSNAVCPGGYRLWPKPGWWISSESAGVLTQCLPGRCLGGQSSVCAAGYTGAACGQCESGYYLVGLECVQCQAPYVQALLLLVQFAFSLLLFIAIFVLPDAALNNLQFVLACLRMLWVMSADGALGQPQITQSVYGIFGLFAGDLQFVRPGCSGVTSYLQVYAINITVMLGLVLPITLVYVLKYRLLVWRVRKEFGKEDSTDAEQMVALHYHQHMCDAARGIVAQVMFAYQIVLVKSLQSFYCTWQEDALRLVIDSNVVCFQSGHIAVFMASLLIVPLVGLALPLCVLRLAALLRNGQRLRPFENAIAMNATEEVTLEQWYFPTMSVLIVDLPLAFNAALLVNYQFAQNLLNVLWAVAAFCYVMYRRPFREWYKNVGLAMALGVSLLVQLAGLAVSIGSDSLAFLISYAMVALLFAWLFMGVLVVIYYLFYLRLYLRVPNQPTEMHEVYNVGQKEGKEQAFALKRIASMASPSETVSPRSVQAWSAPDAEELLGESYAEQSVQDEHLVQDV